MIPRFIFILIVFVLSGVASAQSIDRPIRKFVTLYEKKENVHIRVEHYPIGQNLLITTCDDGKTINHQRIVPCQIRILNSSSGELITIKEIDFFNKRLHSTLSPDGSKILVSSDEIVLKDSIVLILDSGTLEEISRFEYPNIEYPNVGISRAMYFPDGDRILAVGHEKNEFSAFVLRQSDGKIIVSTNERKKSRIFRAKALDNEKIITSGQRLEVISSRTGKREAPPNGFYVYLSNNVAVSSKSGEFVAVSAARRDILLIYEGKKLEYGVPQKYMLLLPTNAIGKKNTLNERHPSKTNKVVFSPDGTLLAAALWHGQALLWDVKSWTLVRDFRTNDLYVVDVSISPDNKKVVTANSDGSIIIWSLK